MTKAVPLSLFLLCFSGLILESLGCGAPTSHCTSPCSNSFPSSGSCNFANIIAQHEGCCQCVYLDSLGNPTIGIGYLLTADRSSELASIGANYNELVSGQSSLTNQQIVTLFNKYIGSSVTTAQQYFSNYNSLCCNVQQGLIDMIYDLSGGIGQFSSLIHGIETQNWKAAASAVQDSLYCKQVGDRCTDDMNLISQGCSNQTNHTQPANQTNHTQPAKNNTNNTEPSHEQSKENSAEKSQESSGEKSAENSKEDSNENSNENSGENSGNNEENSGDNGENSQNSSAENSDNPSGEDSAQSSGDESGESSDPNSAEGSDGSSGSGESSGTSSNENSGEA